MVIKAIIWDMGGVILHMVSEAPRRALAQAYQLSLDKIYWAIFDSPSARQATVGEITIYEHWQQVGETLGIANGDLSEFLQQFWSADAIDEAIIDLIRRLRLDYKIGLLSNAWDNLRRLIDEHWKIADAFDQMIISAEVGLAKPDPGIYSLAVEKLGVLPGEALFIDDVLENVEAAQKAGLFAIQYQTRTQALLALADLLRNAGQELAAPIQERIDALTTGTQGPLADALQLIDLQIRLEYQLVSQNRLIPFPGCTEQAWYVVYQHNGGFSEYFHHLLPEDVYQELIRLGPPSAYANRPAIQSALAPICNCQASGPFRSYYFPKLLSPQDEAGVEVVDGRFEIHADGHPVSWAWSARENPFCAEVAVETLPEFQRRGYAHQVCAAWANSILRQGKVAFFSHAESNLASRRLAHSLGVVEFAACISYE